MPTQCTVLPPEIPDNAIVIPTMNRWGSSLPKLLRSVEAAAAKRAEPSFVLIADGTSESSTHETAAREQTLAELQPAFRDTIKIMTPESQRSIVGAIARASGVEREIAEAYLVWTGYGSQRGKLDMVLRAYAAADARKVVTLDDDTMIARTMRTVNPSCFNPTLGLRVNSQIVVRADVSVEEASCGVNSLRGLFDPLGSPVATLPRASVHLRDTMHTALDEAQRSGKAAQFEVAHDPGSACEAKGIIVATAASKSGVPDYRTVKVAAANLRDEFPADEVAFSSYPAGPAELFAFQRADTNIDSACLGRLFDHRTSQLPWWIITAEELSRQNPLQTVTGHYRADNELLPKILGIVADQTGEQLWYAGGIETQVLHYRARSGYRPEIIEQATASLIGNLAAQAIAAHLEVEAVSLRPSLRAVSDDFVLPEEVVRGVFVELESLGEIAREKFRALDMLRVHSESQEEAARQATLMERYQAIYELLYTKTGGFDYETFSRHTAAEIRAQTRFFGRVVEAAPRIAAIVRDLIVNERYPVLGASL